MQKLPECTHYMPARCEQIHQHLITKRQVSDH